jgi:hypothetical protein
MNLMYPEKKFPKASLNQHRKVLFMLTEGIL